MLIDDYSTTDFNKSTIRYELSKHKITQSNLGFDGFYQIIR